MNKAILTGNVGKDPEIKYLSSGTCLAKFSLATRNKYKKKDEDKNGTTWHNCLAFGKTAELIEKYVKKGDKLGIEGEIKNDFYEKEDGTKIYTSEVLINELEFLGGKPTESAPKPQNKPITTPQSSEEDDGLPF